MLHTAGTFFIDSELSSAFTHSSRPVSTPLPASSWHYQLWFWYSHWMKTLSHDDQLQQRTAAVLWSAAQEVRTRLEAHLDPYCQA